MSKPFIILVVFLFISMSCSYDAENRNDYKTTYDIDNNLHVEVFRIFGQGAFGSDVLAEWLTDSTSFRVFIGKYDELDGGFAYQVSGDTIYITQRPDALEGNPKKNATTTFYIISNLKKKCTIK